MSATTPIDLPAANLPPDLARLYPFASHFLPRPSGRLHYLDEGEGDREPLLLLHGNPTWSFYYRNLVLTLRDRYRLIVPDHIGCGLSDKPSDEAYDYTLSRRVDDIEALLAHLQLGDNLTLVLHDWGGMIGMAMALRRPERIRRLIVLNTAAFHKPSNKPLPWSLWLCRSTPLGPLLIRGMNCFSWGVTRYGNCKQMSAAVRAGYLYPYNSWTNRRAVLRFVQDIPLRPGDRASDLVTQVEKGLPCFRATPMLICWGERDFVFDSAYRDGWQQRFPEAEVHRFADAGHLVLEDAGDEVIPLIRAFLERHPLP